MANDVEDLKNYEDDDSDYDFDDSHFDIYKDTTAEQQITEDFLEKPNPNVVNLRSKFTPAEAEINQISELKGEIRKASIQIIAHLSDVTEIKKYYGLLKAFYISFKTLIDGFVIIDIDIRFKDVKKLLSQMRKTNKTPPEIYEKLTVLTEKLYRISQYKGLGMMVESVNQSSNTSKRIVGE